MNEPKSFYASLAPRARLGLWIGAGVIVVITAAMIWWLLRPREQLLFGNLREHDAAEIVAQLDEWKVPHTIVDGGTGIQVPADQVYDMRMKLVSAGVPRGGHVGFELFDDADFGVTEFAQRVNYQRALQGEIERTIAALPGVETARVHLSIRRPGLFVGEKEASKASVALTLRPGESLSRQQVVGIRSLVAAAVEGLTPSQVSVLDSDGSLLAGGSGAQEAGLDSRTEDEARLEVGIQSKVTDLLHQVLHDEEFKVSVDVTLNFDAIHQVNERPLGQGDDGNGLVRRKRSHSTSPTEGTAPTQNDEEAEYLHGTAREEISRAPGRVERLSVAVILPATLDEFEVPRLRALISAAAGVDESRGDLLEVSRFGRATPFGTIVSSPSEVAAPEQTQVSPTIPLVGTSASTHWTRWLLVGVLGVLVGLTIALGMQKRPRKLKPQEREAILARMRGWLAEGSAA